MKTLLIALLLATFPALAADAPPAAVIDLSRPIPEIRLTTGVVLKNVQIVTYDATTLMARWDGGRGTVTVAHLPPDVKAAVAAMIPAPLEITERPAVKSTPTPAAPKAPTPAAKTGRLASITTSGFDVRAFERNSVFVRVAWKATVRNSGQEPVRMRLNLLLVDDKGFKLIEESSDTFTIYPGRDVDISETELVGNSIYDQMKKYQLEMETM